MARVLEISRIPLFKYCLPAETTWFSLGTALIAGDERCVSEQLSVRNLLRLARDLRRGAYDLVVLPAVEIGYGWDPSWRKRFLRRLVRVAASTGLAAGILEGLLRWRRNVVVFVDVADDPALSYAVCALVPGFLAYFKREFYPQLTLRADTGRRNINDRVVPWSLFLPTADFAPDASEKKTDVFFAGYCYGTVRETGLPQLRQLETLGYKIDVPAERLSHREYMRRMAEAWLVWSPEGFGWDCYRHYEAAFAGAVPVLNEPAHARSRPFTDGVECFFYRPQGDGLTQVLTGALEDKPRLREMAARARARVLAHYTRPALVASMQAALVERLRATGRSSPLLEEWGGVKPAPGPALA